MMKKKLLILICILAVVMLCACSAPATEQPKATAMPDAAPTQAVDVNDSPTATPELEITEVVIEPMDLLSAAYNPFDSVEWPDGYTIYEAGYEAGEYNLYRLRLTTAGSAEDVVTFVSQVFGEDSEENIQASIDYLKDGHVEIKGLKNENGIETIVEINPAVPDDSDYEFVEGYTVALTAGITDEQARDYEEILNLNFNTEAIANMNAQDFLTDNQPVVREIKIKLHQNAIEAVYTYDPGDDFETWEEFFSSSQFADNEDIRIRNEDESDFVTYTYGKMGVQIVLNNGMIYISQGLNDLAQNMLDYVPEKTLQWMGFGVNGEDGNCGYSDPETGYFTMISKKEWGADSNSITLMIMEGYECYLVTYYPDDQRYGVQIESTDHQLAKYYYVQASKEMTPMDEGWDKQGILDNYEEIFDSTDVSVPVLEFDQYIEETFGMTSEALFEVPVE